MGKLVPQDPNDEPAAVLLEKIAAEKTQLIKEKKIKKQKPLPPITEDEKPFPLPEGWEWVRFGSCISLVSGQHLKPDEYSDSLVHGAVPYITGPAEFGPIHPTFSKFTQEKRALAAPRDILVTCKGSGIGKSNIAATTIAISRQLMAIKAILMLDSFAKLQVDALYEYFQSKGVGIAIPGISREDITEVKVLLPPLKEQHRIVAKVDQLMALCDQLKTRLQHAQKTQLHLADALVEQALGV
jgi:type I restriction enzyme S subunit